MPFPRFFGLGGTRSSFIEQNREPSLALKAIPSLVMRIAGFSGGGNSEGSLELKKSTHRCASNSQSSFKETLLMLRIVSFMLINQNAFHDPLIIQSHASQPPRAVRIRIRNDRGNVETKFWSVRTARIDPALKQHVSIN